MTRARATDRQLRLFSRDCPGCAGTGWRTVPAGAIGRQTGGGGRGWYDLLFQCMARSGPVLTERTWGWVEEILGESVPYGEPYTSAWTAQVVTVLAKRYPYRPGMSAQKPLRQRCEICRGKRRVSLTVYETYFLGR